MTQPDASQLKGKTGLRRLINAARYSKDGITHAFTHEEAFRQELIASLVLIPVAFFLPVSLPLTLWCVFSLVNLLVVELLNSGLESAIDRIGLEIHPLSKSAKDCGSAAVLLSLIFAAVAWVSTLISIALR